MLHQLVGYYSAWCLANRKVHLYCVGRADRRGKTDYNKQLAERRANMVKQFLDGLLVPVGALPASVKPDGEKYATDDMSGDRRVDIYEWIGSAPPTPVFEWRKIEFWLELQAVDVYFWKKLLGNFFAKESG